MGGGDVCDLCPSANTYLVSAETESDEKQYSCSVERLYTSPSGGTFGSEDSGTRASFTMGRNRAGTLDSAPPLITCYAREETRLCLLLRPSLPRFQMFWGFFCSHRWDRVADDGFALLQEEQTARCSCSLLWSPSLSWPEVETAQSSRNSSWGSV